MTYSCSQRPDPVVFQLSVGTVVLPVGSAPTNVYFAGVQDRVADEQVPQILLADLSRVELVVGRGGAKQRACGD